ncbi:dihydroorotate dehydrogenase electron transfer subunit [Tuberibacillus sp. Marseille-P3662]|uniref:dihydroorotate dehydrogenase electron transfer subunit n=1 Tax=Tuberibacillus sp. Marseille-P3662 TaxID=1965358 RepID=UPI000A1CB09D|nr:dihydroorotate dehydrogenase electron transfer subunit [Tuberibacillus sp. Marseille-P3662]
MMTIDATINEQRLIADHILEMTLTLPSDGPMFDPEPGQFVHVQTGSANVLRRPLSICDYDSNMRQLTLIYRLEGEGTRHLSERKSGETVNLLAPLGQGFPLSELGADSTALLVGGGVGVPPLYYLSKQLRARGVKPIHVLGFADKKAVFYDNKFCNMGETFVATVDGSAGTQGFVTDVINQRGLSADVIYACGPVPMLQAMQAYQEACPVYISLETRMGCALGACYACVCGVPGSASDYKKVCTDGPVFQVGEVELSC